VIERSGEESADDDLAALVAAVRSGDTSAATALVERSPGLRDRLNDPLPGLPFDATILQPAVAQQHRDMIDLLIGFGADINGRSHWWAGGFGHLDLAPPELVPFLRDRGAKMTIHAAARLGLIDDVAAMLEGDAALARARGGDGQTPLHVASTVEIATLLLEKGADIDALDTDHESTPAQYLVGEHVDVARYLVSRGCRTDILAAAAIGDIDWVRTHLDDNSAAVGTTVSDEYFPKRDPRAGGTIYIWTLGASATAHLVAHRRGYAQIVALLMERSPAALAFAMACRMGDAERAGEIRAANPGLPHELGQRERQMIVSAADAGDTTGVQLMLASGWPPEARNGAGVTALHWAAWHGNVEMIRDLLAHGAPLDAMDNTHLATPVQWGGHGRENGGREGGDYAAALDLLQQRAS
jgi:ankyrin repeat protein